MSSGYPGVKAQFVTLLEATEPDDHTSATAGRFTHQPQGIDGAHVPDRGFVVLGSGGVAELPGCFQGKGRMNVTIQVAVLYKAMLEMSALDTTVHSDAENLIAQMLKESNWDRASTGIELVGSRSDNKSALPYEVIPNEDGSLTLLFSFPVVYARGVETNTPTP